jgi:C4-dicarboxylate transporter
VKKLVLAASIAVCSTNAFAGGLAEPTMEPAVVIQKTSSSAGGILIPLLILILVAAAASSSGGGNTPAPVPG